MRPDLERYAHEGDAVAYWRSFPVTVHFGEPITIVGVLQSLEEQTDRNRDGSTARHPKLRVRDDDGQVFIIVARQARLLAELVDKHPVVGDRVRIVYTGLAERAAPGMSPTKEFRVDVSKPRPPEVRTEPAVGAPGPENVPRAAGS